MRGQIVCNVAPGVFFVVQAWCTLTQSHGDQAADSEGTATELASNVQNTGMVRHGSLPGVSSLVASGGSTRGEAGDRPQRPASGGLAAIPVSY